MASCKKSGNLCQARILEPNDIVMRNGHHPRLAMMAGNPSQGLVVQTERDRKSLQPGLYSRRQTQKDGTSRQPGVHSPRQSALQGPVFVVTARMICEKNLRDYLMMSWRLKFLLESIGSLS